MDVFGLEFSYLSDDEQNVADLSRRNRMALLKRHVQETGSAELPPDIQQDLGETALFLAEQAIDLLSVSTEADDDDDEEIVV